MRNPVYPGMDDGTVEVTGELQIRSTLTRIRSVQLTMAEQNLVANEESKLSWYQLDPLSAPGDFVIRVEKSGAGEGSVGDSAVKVSYLAFGE